MLVTRAVLRSGGFARGSASAGSWSCRSSSRPRAAASGVRRRPPTRATSGFASKRRSRPPPTTSKRSRARSPRGPARRSARSSRRRPCSPATRASWAGAGRDRRRGHRGRGDPARAPTTRPAGWRGRRRVLPRTRRGCPRCRPAGRRIAAGVPRSDLWHADGRPAVIVADDLDPSDVATLRPELVVGIALAGGAPTGHAAIVARGLGIPLVLGLGAGAVRCPTRSGRWSTGGRRARGGSSSSPTSTISRRSTRGATRLRPWTRRPSPVVGRRGASTVTANVGSVLEAEAAARAGAAGSARPDRAPLPGSAAPPSVAEQRNTYARIREAMGRGRWCSGHSMSGATSRTWQGDGRRPTRRSGSVASGWVWLVRTSSTTVRASSRRPPGPRSG